MDDRKSKPHAPTRRYPVHGTASYPGKPLIVFVTVCTRKRRPWLATPEVHQLLRAVWVNTDEWMVGRYVIMPDHVHLFASPKHENFELGAWIRHWKTNVSNRVNDPTKRWQRDYWDRRLRSTESYDQKWDYVVNNPVRHKLVTDPQDWPYQGTMNPLDW